MKTKALRKILVVSFLVGAASTALTINGCGPKLAFQTQGSTSPDSTSFKTETVKVSSYKKPVDILFITDNSRSMRREQSKMSQKFNSFIQDMSRIDWQIGITTTDVSNRGLQGELSYFDGTDLKVITTQTPDAEELFRQTVQREEVGASTEQPLAAAIAAMEKRNNENQGFFRDNADLAIIVLSDEDESSRWGRDATTPRNVLSTFKNIWPHKSLKFYGIIVEPKDRSCLSEQSRDSSAAVGESVSDLAHLTGGLTASICLESYGDSLKSIGTSINNFFKNYTLSQTPKEGTLSIQMMPEYNISWTVSGNVITFDEFIPENTYIRFVYEQAEEQVEEQQLE